MGRIPYLQASAWRTAESMIERRNPQLIRRWLPVWEWFYRHYFRVRTSGCEHIPAQGQLMLVGSHNGGLATPDLPMFLVDWFRRFGYERRPHERGMPWLLGIDPEVFPVYLGLPWGLALGPLPNLPLPAWIHTRLRAPLRFERSGYVRACYGQVVERMQHELEQLAEQASRP